MGVCYSSSPPTSDFLSRGVCWLRGLIKHKNPKANQSPDQSIIVCKKNDALINYVCLLSACCVSSKSTKYYDIFSEIVQFLLRNE